MIKSNENSPIVSTSTHVVDDLSHPDVKSKDIENRITFENVSYSYEGRQEALKDVSLKVDRGEFVCIIGNNGSGKSTLVKHINALLLPEKGKVITGSIDTTDKDGLFTIRSNAGMVFQNPDSQIVASIVEDDVAFGPENQGVNPEEIRPLVESSIDAVHMSEFALSSPSNLSGGQKQRISIAGILAMKPDLLILDEPGAMLDPRGRRGIRRVARELNDAGLTVVLITHFIEDTTTADRIIVLENGEIIATGTPIEIYGDEEFLESHNIAVPFSINLSIELRKRGIEIDNYLVPKELREQLCQLALEM